MAGPINVGTVHNPVASFSRPNNTTAYGAADLIANSATAASVSPMEFIVTHSVAGGARIRRARMYKSQDSLTNATFRLHLFRTSPTVGGGDNAAIAVTTAVTTWLGTFAFDMTSGNSPDVFSTGGNVDAAVPLNGTDINVRLTSGTSVYGLLEATAAYTPAANETFTVELEVVL